MNRLSVIAMMAIAVLFFSCTATKKTSVVSIKLKPMTYTGIYPRADWIANTNVYEVNIRQFTTEGTFNAFATYLPRLKNMGVKTLWFMPITPIASENKKGSLGSPYACSDYTAINPEFGTMQDWKNLVDKAHSMGFKVIIDWVANHTGWNHIWTKSHPEYYLKDPKTNNFQIASGMDDIIELDYSNPNLRKAMIDAMRFWITNTNIDGFRCDLAAWVELDFWQQARTELEKTKNLFWLGELDPLENPDYMQVFDCAYTWTWMHKTKEYKEGKYDAIFLKNILNQYDTIAGSNALKLWFTTNHDENSWNGTEYEKYGEMAKALAVFSYTFPGIPLTYSGQEIPNHKRLEFFEKDPIQWKSNLELEDFYRTLNELKSNHQCLVSGNPDVKLSILTMSNTNPNSICYFLRKGATNNKIVVLLNLSGHPIEFRPLETIANGFYNNVFDPKKVVEFSDQIPVQLKPWDYLVLQSVEN